MKYNRFLPLIISIFTQILLEVYVLQNLSSYGNFLAFYFCVSAVYGLNAFLKVSIWILIILLMLVIMPIMYQILWTYKIDLKTGYFYILLVLLTARWI